MSSAARRNLLAGGNLHVRSLERIGHEVSGDQLLFTTGASRRALGAIAALEQALSMADLYHPDSTISAISTSVAHYRSSEYKSQYINRGFLRGRGKPDFSS